MSQQRQKGSTRFESLIDADLPETLNGWHRLHRDERENREVEYWRAGSTHVSGEYEQLVIGETSDGDYRLSEHTYDQFNNLVSTQRRISEKRPKDAGLLWNYMKKRIMRSEGEPQFRGPPTLPEQIRNWELIERRHEGENRDAIRWSDGQATVTVEEVEITGSYCQTRRDFAVRHEGETGPTELVSSVPRKAAFEIATFVMRRLPRSPESLDRHRAGLEDLPTTVNMNYEKAGDSAVAIYI